MAAILLGLLDGLVAGLLTGLGLFHSVLESSGCSHQLGTSPECWVIVFFMLAFCVVLGTIIGTTIGWFVGRRIKEPGAATLGGAAGGALAPLILLLWS